MVWLPTVRLDVVNVAWPDASVAPVANMLIPSWNVMVPVGVPDPGEAADTVAVKVTVWPKTEGFAAELTATTLASWATSCGDPESSPLLGWKFPSPEYDALIV